MNINQHRWIRPMREFMMPAILLALLATATPAPATAASSYDSCSGFIDSVPATITTQGVWCLRADLSTAVSSGNAILVNANNVTIDCNRFKLGGLAAGTDSQSYGIYSQRLNTSVRNCNVRGFYVGIHVDAAGALIESNRLDGNLYRGIYAWGLGTLVRDNQVFDTGGSTLSSSAATGIFASGGTDVIGNMVSTVSGVGANFTGYGIQLTANSGGTLRDNRVKGVLSNGAGVAYAIYAFSSPGVFIRDNDLQGTGASGSVGIFCAANSYTAGGNFIHRFATPIQSCFSLDNTINPN